MNKTSSSIALSVVITLLAGPTVVNAAQYEVSQVTLKPFSGKVTSLTTEQKTQVAAAVEASPNAEKFICTGIRAIGASSAENILVRSRAKAACDYAASMNPALSTWVQSKPTKAASYVGKVLLTVKSPSSSSVDDSATFSPSLDSMSATQIQARALGEVSRTLKSASSSGAPVEFHVSSDYPKDFLQSHKVTIERTLRYFADQENLSMVDAVFFTQASGTWAQQTWEDILAGTGLAGRVKIYLPEMTNDYGRALTYNVGNEKRGIFYMNSFGKSLFPELPAHEVTHLFQKSAHLTPVWLTEGSATFYGSAIGNLPTSPDALKIRVDSSLKKALLGSDDSVIALFKKYEVQNPPSAGSAYTLGCMLFTVLVARFGEEKAWQFMQMFDSGSELRTGFKQIFGMTLDDFYLLALPTVRELAKMN